MHVNANDEAERLLYLHAALACVEAWCSHVKADEELTAPFMPDILEHVDAVVSARCHDDDGQWQAARRGIEDIVSTSLGLTVGHLREAAKGEMVHSLRDLERLFAATIEEGDASTILSECYRRFRAIADKPLPAPILSEKRASIIVERALKAADCIHKSQCLRGGTRSQADEGGPSNRNRVSIAGDEPAPNLNRALARIISGQERADESLQEMLDLLSKDRDVPKLLSPAEAAKLTGIGAGTLRAAFDRGEITGKQVGQHRKLDTESLRAWCRSRHAETNGQASHSVPHDDTERTPKARARAPRRFIPPT
jgi:excisionase family DNA binding protein